MKIETHEQSYKLVSNRTVLQMIDTIDFMTEVRVVRYNLLLLHLIERLPKLHPMFGQFLVQLFSTLVSDFVFKFFYDYKTYYKIVL